MDRAGAAIGVSALRARGGTSFKFFSVNNCGTFVILLHEPQPPPGLTGYLRAYARGVKPRCPPEFRGRERYTLGLGLNQAFFSYILFKISTELGTFRVFNL